jgi:hypothetical protein
MSLRDVVEGEVFTQDIDNLRRLYGDDIDELHRGITWALSNDPRIGDPLPQAKDYRVFTTTPIGKLPAFWVMYTFDTEKVHLVSLQEVTE